jgi:hypothetical protein
MRVITVAVLLLAAHAVVTSCGRSEEPTRSDAAGTGAKVEQTIALTPGDTIKVGTQPDGATRIVVTIQAGKPHAGTYASSSSSLAEAAHDAARGLTEPNSVSAISVDAAGNILSISNEVTKR